MAIRSSLSYLTSCGWAAFAFPNVKRASVRRDLAGACPSSTVDRGAIFTRTAETDAAPFENLQPEPWARIRVLLSVA
jgi:hypothetical protein